MVVCSVIPIIVDFKVFNIMDVSIHQSAGKLTAAISLHIATNTLPRPKISLAPNSTTYTPATKN